MAGSAQFIVYNTDVLAGEREILQPTIAAVGHQEFGRDAPSVDEQAMRAFQLPIRAACPAKACKVIPLLIVTVNVVLAVAVGNEDATIGRGCHIRGLVFAPARVEI